jgi:hypothetical protein
MRSDFIILIMICAALVFVTLNSVSASTTQYYSFNEEAEEGTLVSAVVEAFSDVTVKEYETSNGMKLTLGRVDNYGDEEKNVIVPVFFNSKTIYYNLTLPADRSWTYATVNGVLILPQTPMIIDPTKTTYYHSGEQLLISIEKDYGVSSALQIYCDEPSVIMAGTPVRWHYNYKSNSLLISGSNHFSEIMLYFSRFNPSGTVFLEDRSNVEELAYRAEHLEQSIEGMNTTIVPLEDVLNNLTTEIGDLEAERSSVTAETVAIKKSIPLTNRTIDAYEQRIGANAVVSPSFIVIGGIIALILIVVIIDALTLTKKVKK